MILRRTFIFIILLLLLASFPGCEFLEWMAEDEEGTVQLEVDGYSVVWSSGVPRMTTVTGVVVNYGTRTARDVTINISFYDDMGYLGYAQAPVAGFLPPETEDTFEATAYLERDATRLEFRFSYSGWAD